MPFQGHTGDSGFFKKKKSCIVGVSLYAQQEFEIARSYPSDTREVALTAFFKQHLYEWEHGLEAN